MQTTTPFIALILAAFVAFAGCGTDADADDEHHSALNFERAAVQRLSVAAGDGDVLVIASNTVSVEAWTLGGEAVEATVVDGELRVADVCAHRPECVVRYRVGIPAETPVKVLRDAGHVTLAKLAGPVEVQSAQGGVRGVALGSPSVVVAADDGDVVLSWDRAPDGLLVHAGAGDVDVTVPIHFYRLDIEAGGVVDVGALTDVLKAKRHLTVQAPNGDVRLHAAAPQGR